MPEIVGTYQITTSDGLLEVEEWDNGIKTETLIEPSEQYILKLQVEREIIEEQKILDNLIPSQEEIQKAETEIQIITILMEVELI